MWPVLAAAKHVCAFQKNLATMLSQQLKHRRHEMGKAVFSCLVARRKFKSLVAPCSCTPAFDLHVSTITRGEFKEVPFN